MLTVAPRRFRTKVDGVPHESGFRGFTKVRGGSNGGTSGDGGLSGVRVSPCTLRLARRRARRAQVVRLRRQQRRQRKQAVLETTAGTIVMDLLADRAPNHVALFIKTAEAGGYDGTTFFRMMKLRHHPGRRSGDEGSGGARQVRHRRAEPAQAGDHRREAHARRRVGDADSRQGRQRRHAVLHLRCRISRRSTASTRSSRASSRACWWRRRSRKPPSTTTGLAVDRIVVTKVTIRDKPAETPEPFSTEPVEELARYRAVLDTSLGEITLSFTPDKAPMHVRNFLRLAQAGVYDGMSFHRVVKGFVIQSGHLPTRDRAAGRNAAEVRAADEGGVQRSAPREGDGVDGPARRSRLRQRVVLHRHGEGRGARRQVHRLRQGRERAGRRREDRGRGRERRDAGRARRAAGR